MQLRRKKQAVRWESTRLAPPSPLTRLRKALSESAARARGRAERLFAHGSRRLSARLLTIGEIVLDSSMTPLGRVLTATAALSWAWALIPG